MVPRRLAAVLVLALAGGFLLLAAAGRGQPPAGPARFGAVAPIEDAPRSVTLRLPSAPAWNLDAASEARPADRLPVSLGAPLSIQESTSGDALVPMLPVVTPGSEVRLEIDMATAPSLNVPVARLEAPRQPPPEAPPEAPPELPPPSAPIAQEEKKPQPKEAKPLKIEDAGDLFVKFLELKVPTRDRLFVLESEERLRLRMADDARAHQLPLKFEFPDAKLPAAEPETPRARPAHSLLIEPDYLCTGRLWFEQPRSERYGRELGGLQPLISAGRFYVDFATWPARWLVNPACYECFPRRPSYERTLVWDPW